MSGYSAVSLFAGDPQPVEIHHRGLWFSGELLGWVHTDEGRVLGRVRCVVDGLRHSTWKDLAELRLPDPARPPRRETFPAPPVDPPAADDGADATRPHALLTGSRAPKPDHARTPPAARAHAGSPAVAHPAAPARPAWRTNPDRRRSDRLSPV
ncbi:hypothetical protein JKP75_14935 [Blastococcus sp. TML/M2B]|uniref:hypothetical protein n=1 Tax=unclassified Blastococcus TaxID=2619396 RepID=UPI00190B1348|nr:MULTISPECIES: hypothetical protein [unclassified Blastococcus]MBN1093734.1 hypothetical protein [Blastococcus sp. TML/M2B]MBN1096146.1 hypothetical protein [Blastococcus sp. TML/C7B]